MKRLFTFLVSALFAAGAWAEELQVNNEYVDLGLSVKWATCNLGATSPTEAGWYLAWGESAPKATYTWNNYLTITSAEDAGSEKDPLKEYLASGSHEEGIGGTEYDAATNVLGAGYRMPTEEEFAELTNEDNCSWVWYAEGNSEFNGVAGYKVTSKKEGFTENSIFFPAAGARDGESLIKTGEGRYWSTTPFVFGTNGAICLGLSSDSKSSSSLDSRYVGNTVRAVYEGETKSPYDYLVSLIGDKVYGYSMYKFYVEDGVMTLEVSGIAKVTIEPSSEIKVNGGEYYFTEEDFKIVVEDEAIAHIYAMSSENTIVFEFTEDFVSEDELVELLGDDVYLYGPDGGTISVVNGFVAFTYGEDSLIPLSMVLTLSKTETGYVYSNAEGAFVFNVADGKITSVQMIEAGYEPITLVKQGSTPTAVEAVSAGKAQKAVKAVENGRIVIIRGDKKFDLSGRRIK